MKVCWHDHIGVHGKPTLASMPIQRVQDDQSNLSTEQQRSPAEQSSGDEVEVLRKVLWLEAHVEQYAVACVADREDAVGER